MTHFPAGNRVLRGAVCWQEAPECADELSEMKTADRFGWNGMIDLIEEAKAGGVDEDDTQVRSPLPFPPSTAFEPPWMGELKVVGKGGRRHWRLYFGEPLNLQNHVVGIRVWHKLTAWRRIESQRRERDAIVAAMERLKWYFRDQGYEWSQLG